MSGLLDMLFGNGTQGPATQMPNNPVLIPDTPGETFGNILSAVGASLLTGTRDEPLKNLPAFLIEGNRKALASAEKRQKINSAYQGLLAAGVPEEQAKAMARDPDTASSMLGSLQLKKLTPKEPTAAAQAAADLGFEPGTPERNAFLKQYYGIAPKKEDVITVYGKDGKQRSVIKGVDGSIRPVVIPGEENAPEELDTKGAPKGMAWNKDKTGVFRIPGYNPPPSATELKERWQQEDEIPQLDSTIETLRRARELNYKTLTGPTAAVRTAIGNIPALGPAMGMDDGSGVKASREFNQIMKQESISAMSQTLKGATTDREMQHFVDLLADPTTPPQIRARTIDRMLTLAQRKRDTAGRRIQELSGAGAGSVPNRGGSSSGNTNTFDWSPNGGLRAR